MPRIQQSSYRPPLGFRNAHLQTIYPALLRRPRYITHERERIQTTDNDFLDLDWARTQRHQRLAIITHGLEGSTRGPYVQGMANALQSSAWDICAWNFRGCSGVPNKQLRTYHSGASEELDTVLQHILRNTDYSQIALIGFSLGGNLMLKYLGEHATTLDPRIQRAVALSVPCDLASSAKQLEHWSNRIYMRRFMNFLRPKIREKIQRFPDRIHDHGLDQMRTFAEFDDAYTAPIHGFQNAQDYWQQCSSRRFVSKIQIPTLLINAKDDPFLTPDCFPEEQARQSQHFHLETPNHGGHVGFIQHSPQKHYWSETRALEFLTPN